MDRQSIQTIYQRVKGDLSSLDLRYSVKRVLSHAITGTAHMLNGYAEHLAKLVIPDSEDENILLAWCNLYGIEQTPASQAEIIVSVESTDSVFIPTGTTWTHENGTIFILKESETINGAGDLRMTCKNAGKVGNVEAGDNMTVSSTLPLLKSAATVKELIVEGFDTEPLPKLRSRLRERMIRPPQGGAPNDYINWALEYPAATRAWVLPRHDENGNEKNGHVCIAFLKESGQPTDQEGMGLLYKVKRKCPVSAIPHVVKVSTEPLNLDLELEHDQSLSTDQLKARITKELSFMLNRVAAPKGYLNKNLEKESGTVFLSDISRAISLIPEVTNHRIKSPLDHVEPSKTGAIIVLGEIKL